MSAAEATVEMDGDTLRRHLRQLHPLNQLDEAALVRLMPALRVVRYAAQTPLYRVGESPADNFYVLQGCVCLYDRDWTPQLNIQPDPHGEAMPLPYAVPAEERALVVEPALVLQVDRALLAQATQRSQAGAGAGRVRSIAAAPTASAAPAPPVTASPADAVADASGSRVLVVEHHPAEARACRALITATGLLSDWVTSAEEAIELLQIERYGAVFLDVLLPQGDAFDVVKFIRESGPSRPRIIAMADALHEDRAGCLAAGMDDVIGKPLTAAAMHAKLVGSGFCFTTKAQVEPAALAA